MTFFSSCIIVVNATKLFLLCPVSNTAEMKKWIQQYSRVHPSYMREEKIDFFLQAYADGERVFTES